MAVEVVETAVETGKYAVEFDETRVGMTEGVAVDEPVTVTTLLEVMGVMLAEGATQMAMDLTPWLGSGGLMGTVVLIGLDVEVLTAAVVVEGIAFRTGFSNSMKEMVSQDKQSGLLLLTLQYKTSKVYLWFSTPPLKRWRSNSWLTFESLFIVIFIHKPISFINQFH